MSSLDFAFDERVVAQYDALRGHPTEVAHIIGEALFKLIRPQAREFALRSETETGSPAAMSPRVLELGVGTGRIALPVAHAGAEVIGIDLSANMLATLATHLQRSAADIHLVRGDITALPFRAGVFDAAMVTHVLHLVADWPAVLKRLAQVVKPGGVLLLGRDWVDPASMAGQIRMAFRQAVMKQGFKTAAPAGGPALHQALLAIGATAVGDRSEAPSQAGAVAPEIIAAEWQARISPDEVLAGIRSRDDAESWVLPDDILTPVCAELDAFVADWPNKKAPQDILRRFMVSVYRTAEA